MSSASSCTWSMPLILGEFGNVLLLSRKDMERDFIQLSQYIASGKVDSPSPEIRAKKITQLIERLKVLKKKLSELESEEFRLLAEARAMLCHPLGDAAVLQVQFLVASHMARCGFEKTALLMCPAIKSSYHSLRTRLLSGTELDFVESVSNQISNPIYSDFVSMNQVYLASRQPDLVLQIEFFSKQKKAVNPDHKKLFLDFLLSSNSDTVRAQFLASFDSAYCEQTHTISPPFDAVLAAGVSALKVPHVCDSLERNTPTSCISCLLGPGMPAVHRTRSVLLEHNVEEVYVGPDNFVTSTRGTRIYV